MDINSNLIYISDEAKDYIIKELESEGSESLALWLEAGSPEHGEYTYDLYFEDFSDRNADDHSFDFEGLKVVIPAASVSKLEGARLDIADDGDGQQLMLVNPNKPVSAENYPGDLDSETARRIIEVLDEMINPSIAAHGGRAELASVDGSTAYVKMLGGCQGCGLAAVTLSQGIEVAIKDEVPEIISVVDVTDHALGTNPFYQGSKK